MERDVPHHPDTGLSRVLDADAARTADFSDAGSVATLSLFGRVSEVDLACHDDLLFSLP